MDIDGYDTDDDCDDPDCPECEFDDAEPVSDLEYVPYMTWRLDETPTGPMNLIVEDEL